MKLEKHGTVLDMWLQTFGKNAFDFLVYSKRRVEVVDRHGNVIKTTTFRAFEKFVFETLSGRTY